MTFKEMQDRVLRSLEEGSVPQFFTRQDVKDALNEGYEEMSEASCWNEANTAITKTASTYYDLAALLTHDRIIRITDVFNNDTRRWMIPATIDDLEQINWQWPVVNGEPSRFIVKAPYVFGTFPKAGVGTMQVYYALTPVAMSADADVPGFPEEYHDGLMEYALHDLIGADDELKEARVHHDRYMGFEAALTQYVNDRIRLDKISRMGEAGDV